MIKENFPLIMVTYVIITFMHFFPLTQKWNKNSISTLSEAIPIFYIGKIYVLLIDLESIDFFQVHLGEGIAVCEEQLRAVKWSDYRKLTRGLAAILFSPTELATCSVTGQRWSRAGTATERPVKPALDKAKVQAIICE